MKLRKLIGAVAAATAVMASAPASAIDVALELALLVDISGSISSAEYTLQKQGYRDAFLDATIQADIAALPGGIAVTYIEWSGASQQYVNVGWTHVFDAATATAFANAVFGSTRGTNNLTAPGSAINFATPLFGTETGAADNGFRSARQVIDVSGDGEQNDGADTSDARDAALLAGVDAINGLTIGGGATLQNWYSNNVVGGTNSFLVAADSFNDFADAVRIKIRREINETPEPGSLALVGLALLGAGYVRRRAAKA